jgi:hypothetical protein
MQNTDANFVPVIEQTKPSITNGMSNNFKVGLGISVSLLLVALAVGGYAIGRNSVPVVTPTIIPTTVVPTKTPEVSPTLAEPTATPKVTTIIQNTVKPTATVAIKDMTFTSTDKTKMFTETDKEYLNDAYFSFTIKYNTSWTMANKAVSGGQLITFTKGEYKITIKRVTMAYSSIKACAFGTDVPHALVRPIDINLTGKTLFGEGGNTGTVSASTLYGYKDATVTTSTRYLFCAEQGTGGDGMTQPTPIGEIIVDGPKSFSSAMLTEIHNMLYSVEFQI